MQHEFQVIGEAFQLRPVHASDAEFIYSIRTDPVLSEFIGETRDGLDGQKEWLAAYESQDGDFYFIVEKARGAIPVGTIGIYDIDFKSKSAEWGRWLIMPGSSAAVESALLLYRFAFNVLKLEHVYCRTVVENCAVHSFHSSCGLLSTRRIPKYVEIGGVSYDVVEQSINRDIWAGVENRLSKLSLALAKKL